MNAPGRNPVTVIIHCLKTDSVSSLLESRPCETITLHCRDVFRCISCPNICFDTLPVSTVYSLRSSFKEINFAKELQFIQDRRIQVSFGHYYRVMAEKVEQIYMRFKEHTEKNPAFFSQRIFLQDLNSLEGVNCLPKKSRGRFKRSTQHHLL